jgi:inner membrane protein
VPTVFSHALVAWTVGKLRDCDRRMIGWAVACSTAPDADVIGFYLGVSLFGPFGHRGFSHSLVFAALLAFAVTRLAFGARPGDERFWPIALFLFLVTASHGVLDGFTDAWLGVAYFWPFDESRYLFSWRPLEVSEFAEGLLSRRQLGVWASEMLWIGIPCALALAANRLWRRAR